MKLDRVTITGVDDSVDPDVLAGLTDTYPWVEWGVLVSADREGTPRYPTRGWLVRFLDTLPFDAHVSMHVCGELLDDVLLGDVRALDRRGLRYVDRVQLNVGVRRRVLDAEKVARALAGSHQVIVQIGADRARTEIFEPLHGAAMDIVPLFDGSGGAGIVPTSWPAPLLDVHYQGYAGGLGPETIVAELDRLSRVVTGDQRIWIDMESRVRSADDAKLDLVKVARCLELAAPLVVVMPAEAR